jgi:hypothetical protein
VKGEEKGRGSILVGEAFDEELVDDVAQRPREHVATGHGGGWGEASREDGDL